jgi:MSHA biogenesis protein MshO
MQPQRGFSLIEAVTVIVVVSMLAAVATGVITYPVRSYYDLQRRTTMTDNAESVLRLMQRDIRRALPNSIRITSGGMALELLHVSDGGRYRAYLSSTGSGDILDFTTTDASFDVIGALSAAPTGTAAIYNLGNITADAYSGNNIATLSNTSTTSHIVLAAAKQFPMQSPQQRFFIVDTPISYSCSNGGGTLLRYSGYSISAVQSDPPAGATEAIQANSVSACSFTYAAGTNTRDGLVTLKITLTDSSGESSTLIHEVHVDNAS